MLPKIYSLYDKPIDPGIECLDPSLTQQHFQDECDINLVMERALSTGELPPPKPTYYGDFSTTMDFQSVMDTLNKATEQFQTLPPKVRERFANDPSHLIDFMNDPSNKAEAQFLGLIEPVTVTPLDVTVTTDTKTTTAGDKA
nr:MAG: internal scaffolding protein [Microvirus sp.]